MKTVIIPFYGSNPSRLGCLEKCLEHLLNQKGNFDVLIIYATRDGEFRINKVIEKIEDNRFYKQNNDIKLIHIRLEEKHTGLWQKEALINIGYEEVMYNEWDEDVIFMDGDIYSTNLNWIETIFNSLNTIGGITQGFQFCLPENSKIPRWISETAAKELQTDIPTNPGMVFGMNTSTWRSIKGLNPFMFYGGGDSLFYHEVDMNKSPNFYYYNFPKLKNIIRKTSSYNIKYIKENIIHIDHEDTKMKMETYVSRHNILDKFEGEIRDIIYVDDNKFKKILAKTSKFPKDLLF